MVLGVDGATIEIDKGLTDGLRPGDRGAMFYELTVGGESKRVDLGWVEVVSIEASRARVRAPDDKTVRPGFKAEFAIDKERLSPGNMLAAVHEYLGEEAAVELARRYLKELQPAVDAGSPVGSEPTATAAADTSVGLPSEPAMLRIAGGEYAIGLDTSGLGSGEARFYNESPRFKRTLDEFRIDSAASDDFDVDFSQAQSRCDAQGKRLPTEFEWEIAAQHPDFKTSGRFEWTSSWYLAYPGNRRAEAEYGKRFRVLRGSTGEASLRPQERHYFNPSEGSESIGFRCASSDSDSG